MPHEELTPRSDSISTESSTSPPENLGSNHSETSSGVHSNASSDHNHQQQVVVDTNQTVDTNQIARRATSVADLAQPMREDQWKSCSLQRNVQPPTNVIVNQYPNQQQPFYNNFPHHTKNHSIGTYNVSSSNHTNHTNGQPIYGYSTKNPLMNKNVSSPNTTQQPVYVTNANGTQSLYGYTTQQPQTVNNQPGYGSQTLYGYNNGSNNQQQNINNSNTVPQPLYGYSGNQPTVVNGLITQNNQPLYGYSGTNNQQLQPLYGYTASQPQQQVAYFNNTTGLNSPQAGNSHQTVQQQPLYGYTTNNSNNGSNNQQQVCGYTSQEATTNSSNNQQPLYGFTSTTTSLSGSTFSIKDSGSGIPVILENAENTVVIRRKMTKSVVCDNSQTPVIKEEPFGRSTNMRMTSFTEHNDLKNIQASSATLPHYPTQPLNNQTPQSQYSTMPLPLQQKTGSSQSVNMGAGTSCNVYPRQHTTIPTHHNGVRLFPANQNPYVKRYQQNGGGRVNGEGIYGQKGQTENYYSS